MRRLNSLDFTTHDEVSKWYDDKFTEMGGSWYVPPDELNDLLDKLGVPQSGYFTLLEIGCGDGKLLEQAYLRGGKVYGIDISLVALDYAKKRLRAIKQWDLPYANNKGGWCLEKAAIENLPPAFNSRCDFVVSYGALEHCLDIQKAVNSMARALKSHGGRWLNYAPNSEWIHEDQPLETTMDPEEWQVIYDKAGLLIESVTKINDNTLYIGIKP